MGRVSGVAALLASAVALTAGISFAGASTKFAYTEQVTADGSLVVDFEEGGLKRFASVAYQLEGTETSQWDSCGGGSSIVNAVSLAVALAPDEKGRTSGTITFQLPPSGQLCAPQHVAYTDMTLTNGTTGHVYRLDSISSTFP
jgi:hypothetical protein